MKVYLYVGVIIFFSMGLLLLNWLILKERKTYKLEQFLNNILDLQNLWKKTNNGFIHFYVRWLSTLTIFAIFFSIANTQFSATPTATIVTLIQSVYLVLIIKNFQNNIFKLAYISFFISGLILQMISTIYSDERVAMLIGLVWYTVLFVHSYYFTKLYRFYIEHNKINK